MQNAMASDLVFVVKSEEKRRVKELKIPTSQIQKASRRYQEWADFFQIPTNPTRMHLGF